MKKLKKVSQFKLVEGWRWREGYESNSKFNYYDKITSTLLFTKKEKNKILILINCLSTNHENYGIRASDLDKLTRHITIIYNDNKKYS